MKDKTMTQPLHFNLTILNAGHHPAAWRLRDSNVEQLTELAYFRKLLQRAEAGGIHSAYFPDLLSADEAIDRTPYSQRLEPLTLLAALAASTRHIGLIAGVSTVHTLPYNLARRLASLDHVSNGRAGWGVITTTDARSDLNFGQPDAANAGRLRERAAEFVDVLQKLWDSWQDDAQVNDKAAGIYVETARVHEIAHEGRNFRVSGPLDVPRSPQGHPVLVQEVRSPAEFLAESVEVALIPGSDRDASRALYGSIKASAEKAGRAASSVRVLPALNVLVAPTSAEARATAAELDKLAGTADGSFIVGDAVQIADHIEQWAKDGAADGFDLRPAALPSGLEAFVSEVVPELRKRGLIAAEYQGSTLREHYGFARPASRYAA